jgi:hypothetical protein
MDTPYLDNIKEYLKSFPGISFHLNTNVIESDVLNKISAVDLLFIDANHDYILARWYIQNLFGLLNKNSVIHLHDMHYNKTGKGWHDITFEGSPQDHPDIVDTDVLRQLYPTIFDEYFMGQTPVNRYEGDEVADFYKNNKDKLSFFSTTSLARQLGVYKPNTEGMVIPEPCSLYFYVKDPASLVTGHNFEDREKGYCENTFART